MCVSETEVRRKRIVQWRAKRRRRFDWDTTAEDIVMKYLNNNNNNVRYAVKTNSATSMPALPNMMIVSTHARSFNAIITMEKDKNLPITFYI